MLTDVTRRRVTLRESGLEIALLDWGGEGPLALLHHANGFCAAVWGVVAESLRSHYRVIAMDARGHGDSSKPRGADAYGWEHFGSDVADVGQQLATEHGDGRIALGLGHSFGGTSILVAASAHAQLFDKCLLLDPVIPPPEWAEADPMRQLRGTSLAEGARSRRRVWPSRAEARAKWSEKELFAGWDPRVFDLYLAEGLRDRPDGQVELKCSGETEAMVFESSFGVDIWSLARKVVTPTRIVRAAKGQFPRHAFDEFAARMSNADVCDADAGHLILMEQPDLVVEAVREFALG